MKAFLIIAPSKEKFTKERYEKLMDELSSFAEKYQLNSEDYNYFKTRIKKAYELCKEKKYQEDVPFKRCGIKDEETLEIAQYVFSLKDLISVYLDFPFVPEKYEEYNQGGKARNGIIYELREDYYNAYKWYNACDFGIVQKHSYKIKKLLDKENHSYYIEGKRYFDKGNYPLAYYPLSVASDHGDDKSTLLHAEMLIKGLGCDEDPEAGYKILHDSLVYNTSLKEQALKKIVDLYDQGYLYKNVDVNEIEKELQYFINLGCAWAKKRMIRGFDHRNVIEILKSRVELGSVEAMLYLGMNIEGEENRELYLKKASDLGNGKASYLLAKKHKDLEDKYLSLSSSQGYAPASNLLMKKYKDDKKLYERYAKEAADNNDIEGMYNYAQILEAQGENEKALALYEKTGEAGNLPSLVRLCQIYEHGELGQKVDKHLAIYYLFMSGLGRD